MKTSRYLKAARCESVDRPPIWMMRQAGRYMKSYQAIRSKYSMLEVMKTPELACEVTLQPIKAFGMDAAIIFSDILTVPDALGLGLDFPDGKGPVIAKPITTVKEVESLDIDAITEKLDYVKKAIKLSKKELNCPLIGFAGAPFTLASYIVGDGKGHDLSKFMSFAFANKPILLALLDKLSLASAHHLNLQIKAGVDAIQIFDSWSSVLSWGYFQELALPYLKKVISLLHNPKKVPITVFGTGHSVFYPLLQDIGANVISLDSKIDMAIARKEIRPDMAVQGNLDPYFLLAPKKELTLQVKKLLKSMEGKQGFIFNLGHGVLPTVPEENVKLVVDLVKES